MTALLMMLTLVLIAIQGPKLWVRVTHPFKYEDMVRSYAAANQLDPLLVAAVINVESKFDPDATSAKGAKGLMQLMDDTAIWAAGKMELGTFYPEQLYDPEINIRVGCWYLSKLIKQFEGDESLALAAYNGGSGNVAKWLQDPSLSSDGNSLDRIPFTETEAYVEKVEAQRLIYNELYPMH